jgi:hypothetical protein
MKLSLSDRYRLYLIAAIMFGLANAAICFGLTVLLMVS